MCIRDSSCPTRCFVRWKTRKATYGSAPIWATSAITIQDWRSFRSSNGKRMSFSPYASSMKTRIKIYLRKWGTAPSFESVWFWINRQCQGSYGQSPVSYTHLTLICSCNEATELAHITPNVSLITVSYTHLDVYKRQVPGLCPYEPWHWRFIQNHTLSNEGAFPHFQMCIRDSPMPVRTTSPFSVYARNMKFRSFWEVTRIFRLI